MNAEIPFPETPRLENDRVLLRALQPADAEHLLPFSLHEPELWLYSSQNAAGEAQLGAYIARAIAARGEKKEMPFIVFDKRDNRYAGCTRFYDIQTAQATLQLGYTWYGRAFQGTGLNRNCKFLMLSYAFDVWGMERVEFRADSRNSRSLAAMRGIGCTVEGTLRSTGYIIQGLRRDSVVLSIIKGEWQQRLRERLAKSL